MIMTDDEKSAPASESHRTTSAAFAQDAQWSWSRLQVPKPLKQLFDRFPLRTYPENDLPSRTLRDRNEHALYVFTTDEDAAAGRPSFNPQCLQYQAFLKFSNLQYRTVASNNHASPSGSLPFLQPAVSSSGAPSKPVPGNKLRRWLNSQPGREKVAIAELPESVIYQTLLDNKIRIAWLCQLYLSPPNAALVRRLYVDPCSSHSLVRLALAHQLQAAAESEVIKTSRRSLISLLDIMRDAGEAFQSLSHLLGENKWFSGDESPGMFDASVFAYTHLIVTDRLQWSFWPLREALVPHGNLLRHQQRIMDLYF